jgi:hypothetical protein
MPTVCLSRAPTPACPIPRCGTCSPETRRSRCAMVRRPVWCCRSSRADKGSGPCDTATAARSGASCSGNIPRSVRPRRVTPPRPPVPRSERWRSGGRASNRQSGPDGYHRGARHRVHREARPREPTGARRRRADRECRDPAAVDRSISARPHPTRRPRAGQTDRGSRQSDHGQSHPRRRATQAEFWHAP